MLSYLHDVVVEHAEETSFLWGLRDAATEGPHYTLADLAELEQRIEAHLDGLRTAGESGAQVAWARFDAVGGPGELFALTVLALEQQGDSGIETVLDMAGSAVEARRGLFGAVGWVPPTMLRGRVLAWVDAPSAFRRLIGAVACSLHRADPGARLESLLRDEPSVRARALRLAGELGRTDVRSQVRDALDDEDDTCRFWAAWGAGLLGDRAEATPILQAYATGATEFRWRALELAMRLLAPPVAASWLRDLPRDPANMRALITACGVLGDAVVVPWLIQIMEMPALTRLAGESFSLITGADLAPHGLQAAPPTGFETGPTDDATDEDVGMDPDQDLPWPDPAKVRAWWGQQESGFLPGIRYLCGVPLSASSCATILREGNQRHRRAASYEWALLSGGRLWNWKARAEAQEQALGGPGSL